ncbi:unnamed protein product [Prorocentrum cordatum]|uniref:Uncharacterized protein n=1 Tax=Prorocentrum cordatum TaxID=2364126 RepID=A0ABN9SBX9_9DINO|nr:unnamed protein product [Polarella glacialis]
MRGRRRLSSIYAGIRVQHRPVPIHEVGAAEGHAAHRRGAGWSGGTRPPAHGLGGGPAAVGGARPVDGRHARQEHLAHARAFLLASVVLSRALDAERQARSAVEADAAKAALVEALLAVQQLVPREWRHR